MKPTPADFDPDNQDDLLPEYQFDYRQAKPNRFAREAELPLIQLDPDVAVYFHDAESVNRVLRALIVNMPQLVGG
jgi:hypothetical protein